MLELTKFFERTRQENSCTVCHIAIYTAILHCWCNNGGNNPVSISRQQIMQLAKVKRTAYHQCMKQLQAWGFIEYVPSYHPILGSLVYLNL